MHLPLPSGGSERAVAYQSLDVAAEVTDSGETVRSAWIGMEVIGWFVGVPFVIAALLTGC